MGFLIDRVLYLFHQRLGRDLERFSKPENHIERRGSDSLLKPRDITAFQAAETCHVRLAPSFAETPPDDGTGETGTELIDFVQTGMLTASLGPVAVTTRLAAFRIDRHARNPFTNQRRNRYPEFIDNPVRMLNIPPIMKFRPVSLALLGMLTPLVGQEVIPKWDVEIPVPITDGKPAAPAPEPEPIDFSVISSRTTRMKVTESPEMPDLPPITGTINVTVQLVEDPNLPDPPLPLPALLPDDPAVIAQMKELSGKYQRTTLVFVSATVYDNRRTFLEIYPNGTLDQKVTAWSNLDFNYFGGFSTYRVKDAVDGTAYDFGLLMGLGSIKTSFMQRMAARAGREYQPPEIPDLPDSAAAGPAFVVTEGSADSPAMDTLEQIHDLYWKEGGRMEAAFHAREKAYAERKAYLLANPPKPEDVTVQFWKRDHSAPAAAQQLQGGTNP